MTPHVFDRPNYSSNPGKTRPMSGAKLDRKNAEFAKSGAQIGPSYVDSGPTPAGAGPKFVKFAPDSSQPGQPSSIPTEGVPPAANFQNRGGLAIFGPTPGGGRSEAFRTEVCGDRWFIELALPGGPLTSRVAKAEGRRRPLNSTCAFSPRA